MKALTIDPEYTMAIYNGDKTIECRTWKTNHRGPLLICASARKSPGFVSGYAFFTAELTDIEPFTEEHLEAAQMPVMPGTKCYAWHLDNIEEIKPIQVRGKMGLFDVDDELIEYAGEGDIYLAMTDDEFELYSTKFYIAHVFPLIYMPGKQNEAYYKCMEYSERLRANPEILTDGSPIPEELTEEPAI